jgi:hypothetical protein
VRFLMPFVVVLFAAIEINCSFIIHEPKPDHFGAFVVANGRLAELKRLTQADLSSRSFDGTFKEMSNSVSSDPKVYFILYGGLSEPLLVHVEKAKGLYKTVYNNKVDTQIAPIKGEANMVRLQPVPPLTPGLYELSVVGCPDNGLDFRCYFPIKVE